MLFLLLLPPNDLEILYAAVDSACRGGRCEFSENIRANGGFSSHLIDYIRFKYSNPLPCTTFINVVDSRVVYARSLWRIRRTATFKALVSGCGIREEIKGVYSDHIMPHEVQNVRVEGISPEKTPSWGVFEILVSSAVVFVILYAFYTIEGG